jgi:predicted membrane channel-forming protein YqfA (hemolysin III family)
MKATYSLMTSLSFSSQHNPSANNPSANNPQGNDARYPKLRGVFHLLGAIITIFMKTKNRSLRVISYVIMSFITFLLIPKIYTILGLVITAWLLLGGFLYGVGAYIYTIKKPNLISNILEYHEVFHMFVYLASICHFISIWHPFTIHSL